MFTAVNTTNERQNMLRTIRHGTWTTVGEGEVGEEAAAACLRTRGNKLISLIWGQTYRIGSCFNLFLGHKSNRTSAGWCVYGWIWGIGREGVRSG